MPNIRSLESESVGTGISRRGNDDDAGGFVLLRH